MSLFTIADLHLAGAAGDAKSMSVFGNRWIGCREKLVKNWTAIVKDDDNVVIPGDFSWAMTLDEAKDDFLFIESLPGKKYIGKGNHDFWWSTVSKMNRYLCDLSLKSVEFLYNNAFETPQGFICGTRGWFPDPANQKTVGDVDWQRMIDRESRRLRASLDCAANLHSPLPKYVFLHFPPVWRDNVCRDTIDLLHEYGVQECFYGHIHGVYSSEGDFDFEGIKFRMISADKLDFCPHKIS